MSDTVVGSAAIELRGDAAHFQRTMSEAARHFQGVGRKLEGIGRSLTQYVTLPIVGIAAGAVAGATKMDTLQRALTAVAGSTQAAARQFEGLKEIAKLPGLGLAEAVQGSVRLQAVGVSAEVAARSLKAFGNAIAVTGGGKAELERVTVQLGQLAAKSKILAQDLRPIIEAAPAVGKALKDAFGTVDAQQIEELGLTTDQFLNKLLTQLETLPKVTGGARNSFENLGDSLLVAANAIGKHLLPVVTRFVDWTTGLLQKLETLNPEMVRWGIAIAATAALLGPAALGITRLAAATAALSTSLSVGLLPLIGTGGAILIGLGLLTSWFIKGKLGADDATKSVDSLTGALDKLKAASAQGADSNAVLTAMEALQDLKSEIASRPLVNTAELDAIDVKLVALRQRFIQLTKAWGAKTDTVTPPAIGDPKAMDDYIQNLTQAVELGIASRAEQGALRQIMLEQSGIAHGLVGSAEARVTALERARDAAQALVEAARRDIATPVMPTMPQMPLVFGPELSASMERAAASIKQVSETMREFGDLAVGTAMRAGDAFVDFAFGAKDAFHNFARAALADLARLIARIVIIQGLSALFPGSSAIAAIAGRAAGGPVMRNTPYLVGERGPELFVPRSAGKVMPNDQLRGPTTTTLRLDLSGLPPARDPFSVARDDQWQRVLRESLAIAYSDGSLYVQRDR